MTTQPSNESELQLYRVLQRANLLAYYDTFICQGGDDVQQLCEAGEEEFLEIMALVGMASKPLHVRRLQKALQEWMTNPALFQSPVTAPFSSSSNSPLCPSTNVQSVPTSRPTTTTASHPPSHSQNSPTNCSLMQSTFTGNVSTPSPSQFQNSTNMSEYSQPCSPISMNPVLLDRQIQRLADAADLLVKNLPPMDLKPLLNGHKKRISKEIENVMNMSEDDPRRMDSIRKYAAIYGRFDCKRKPEKPLTLHEVSVNEAAAQICSKIPILLYRRDELFPLARQVVRDSGYQYSKGHSRSQSCSKLFDESNGELGGKRLRLDSSPGHESKSGISEEERKRRQDRLEGIIDQLKSLGNKQEELKSQIKDANERQNFQAVTELQNELEIIADHQMQLVNEKAELEKQQRRLEKSKDGDKMDTEDTDSQFSLYSNESTPSLLQESQQDSPPVEIPSNTASTEMYNKTSTIDKKKPNQPGSTNVTSSNSNDSIDFASKQILNDALDEGLRVAKELGQALDENIDLRLFNKYTEALRNSGCFTNLALTEGNPNNNFNHGHNNRPYKEGHRPRGRPPKVPERDLQNNFYEQILSQAQIQQQMLANYQTHLQVQAALAFGDFNLNNGQNTFGATEPTANNEKEMHMSSDFAGQLNEPKQFENNEITNENKECELNVDKDEMAQSLNALISMANGANENIKLEMNLPSVEFKIA